VIAEVLKCYKIQIFRASGGAGEAYSTPPDPLADGSGLAAPTQEPYLRFGDLVCIHVLVASSSVTYHSFAAMRIIGVTP